MIIKTKVYWHNLKARRARSYVCVLNKENLITENRNFVKGGRWSHEDIKFIGRPPLYVLQYKHDTHPGPGCLSVHKYEESERIKTIFRICENHDFYNHNDLPKELESYENTILQWIKEYLPSVLERTIMISNAVKSASS